MARESVRPSSAITSSTPLPVGREGGREGGRTLFADSLRWYSRKLSLLAEEVRVAMATPCRQQL